MRIETLSTFPEMFEAVMGTSIMQRAQTKGILEFYAHNLRDWTHDRHNTTDDEPYGGGHGLIMKCEPIFEACDDLFAQTPGGKPTVIFMAPFGERFSDEIAQELSREQSLLFICGHYEGIDARAYTLADRIISIGDYVLTSGELASLVVIDAVVRKLPGVLGACQGASEESFVDGLLEYPQYTRPAHYRGLTVPDVLLSGNHAAIASYRRQEALRETLRHRPDLLSRAELTDADKNYLKSLSDQENYHE